jgi:hypothetical protein
MYVCMHVFDPPRSAANSRPRCAGTAGSTSWPDAARRGPMAVGPFHRHGVVDASTRSAANSENFAKFSLQAASIPVATVSSSVRVTAAPSGTGRRWVEASACEVALLLGNEQSGSPVARRPAKCGFSELSLSVRAIIMSRIRCRGEIRRLCDRRRPRSPAQQPRPNFHLSSYTVQAVNWSNGPDQMSNGQRTDSDGRGPTPIGRTICLGQKG